MQPARGVHYHTGTGCSQLGGYITIQVRGVQPARGVHYHTGTGCSQLGGYITIQVRGAAS